jgi:hypothetical protein
MSYNALNKAIIIIPSKGRKSECMMILLYFRYVLATSWKKLKKKARKRGGSAKATPSKQRRHW